MAKLSPQNFLPRPPIVVIMGHIDHGKSSLLDYIRKSNVVAGEAGGITQHLSAYEVNHPVKEGVANRITFLDTPGHQAFSKMRSRGAGVADIAILVVSAEDGVKEQTKEALKAIKEAGIPYIVAINKIDKPNANIERTKQNLAENEIYLEGFGGDVPFVPISAKVGTGVSDLLDMLLLVAEMENLTGDTTVLARGVVVESHVVPSRGISATLIITNGTLKKGTFIVAEESLTPVRVIENFLGKQVPEATFSSPIQITGFDSLPPVGASFRAYATKKEAEAAQATLRESRAKKGVQDIVRTVPLADDALIIPVIIKTDVAGTLEAIEKELGKIERERIAIKVIAKGVGTIGENDAKLASGSESAIILGFHTKVDRNAVDIAERFGVTIKTFDIIYELTDWMNKELDLRTPKVLGEEIVGSLKVLKTFSAMKHKQVIGGKVVSGTLELNAQVKIMRRETEIGRGKVIELQAQKLATKKVEEGNECGLMVESKIEIAAGDILEAFVMNEK
ncbi:MAG: translation initiation factor IF-2 [Candidatus Yonathbacteria bacterium RIFCSPLOWO2_01_FULL_47_33b]|uniref:Translation initiation factor IF-2 n=1 Tax=Candidatus Yonathbacteria bacterium RIFCSPLOWO2_01_FULL_47_33b TaxID=1802727 RepID=A0A1G2SE62_9BACT|nr:MAG: translation initiation factor IF-2 [Candidatus Yonathbacteria bacterium RIFCSPLOWO2_01_FULL_47_33b]